MMTQRPYVPMTERDRQALRIAQAEIAAEEARAEEERLKPLRDAEQQYTKNLAELGKFNRETILSGPDDPLVIAQITDPAVMGIRMTKAQAEKHNLAQVEEFKRRNPDFYACPHNRDLLLGYMSRNKIGAILSAATLESAWNRLREYGLTEERPAPEPALIPEPVAAVAPVVEPQAETYQGIDLETGEPRTYTAWEVERLTAEQFKRAMRITKADQTLCRRAW